MPGSEEFRIRHADDLRVDKPWGHEVRWAVTDRYLGKILHVNAGQALSLQYHERKEESLLLVQGSIELDVGPIGGELARHRLAVGDTFHLLPRTVHRLTALEDSELFEVSTPDMEDVVRLEDKYGRA